jgi:hypothetical protein
VLGVCSICGMMLKGKTEVLVKKYVPVLLCPQKKISTRTGLGSNPSLCSERHVRHSYINAVVSCASINASYIIHVNVILITFAAVSPNLFPRSSGHPSCSLFGFRLSQLNFSEFTQLLQARCSIVNDINDTTTLPSKALLVYC